MRPVLAARITRAVVLAAATIVVGALAPERAHALPPGADGQRLRGASEAIEDLRLEEAAAAIDALSAAYPDDPDVRFERALVRFDRGDYQGAASDAGASVVLAGAIRPAAERIELHRLIRATRDINAGFVEQRSADGRYVVRHAPGPDRVVAQYAVEVARAADDAMERELGIRVPGPIRVEVYPTAATLAAVSSLTVEEIERTGTIALSKWNRLMITSPRALVRGYPWADTLGHELVHLVLSRASHDRAPVWMQEGYARFLERTWRGGAPVLTLDPASDRLLRDAAREDRLIAFDRLHPSIAMLPSAEDAALAFAQVATFVELFHAAHGSAGLRDVAQRVAAGVDAREAFAAAARRSWIELEHDWREAVRARPEHDGPIPALRRLRFRHGEAQLDETEEVRIAGARRFVRLGDLLWSRDRARAAAVEYGKAWSSAEGDPIVGSRLARAALAGGDVDRAIEVLVPLTGEWPDHEPLWSVLGSARLARGEREAARAASREAILLNPFDPQPHCDIAQASSDATERSREERLCEELGEL
jgi:tetratricopeptide (TPR) repeat protein